MWSLRTHSTYTFTILIILSYYYNYYIIILLFASWNQFTFLINKLFTVAKKNPFWDIPQGSCQFKGHLFMCDYKASLKILHKT